MHKLQVSVLLLTCMLFLKFWWINYYETSMLVCIVRPTFGTTGPQKFDCKANPEIQMIFRLLIFIPSSLNWDYLQKTQDGLLGWTWFSEANTFLFVFWLLFRLCTRHIVYCLWSADGDNSIHRWLFSWGNCFYDLLRKTHSKVSVFTGLAFYHETI